MTELAPDPADEVFALFARHGGSSYDESVTMTEHCTQTAALALHEGADDDLVVAALLHDIGHLILAEDRGHERFLDPTWDHERVGEEWLRPRFGERVAAAVGAHVDAKRHLCAVDPEYRRLLSPASVASLEVQGGPFDPVEAAAFAHSTVAADAVRVRRWDDDGKVAGLDVPPLESFGPVLRAVAAGGS